MKKISFLLMFALSLVVFTSCEDNISTSDLNYVSFAESSYSAGIDPGSSATVEVTVYTANTSGSDRSISVSVDAANSTAAAGSYVVPTSVVIPSGTNKGTLSIQLSDTNIGIGVNSLVLNFDASQGLLNGGSTTVNYTQNCTEITGTLDIVFDGYGSETSWEILDSLGGVVMSAAEGDYTDGQVSASVPISICAGRDFTFTINDAYGDGLSWPNNGTYTLTIDGVVKAQGGGDFGSSESTAFDTK